MKHLGFVCTFIVFSGFFQGLQSFVGASKNCGGHFTASTGIIKSPNYPIYYPDNTECEWIIEAPIGHQVVLNVKKFEIEPRDCKCDYLEFRNGISPTSPLIGKYCGSNMPKNITSFGNRIYLKFKSDHRGTYPGFHIEWDSTIIGCGSSLTHHNGSIFSPNYPEPCGQTVECEWKIRVSAGNVILFTIIDLEFQSDEKCEFEFLEIYEGADTQGTKLGRYCHADYPLQIKSTSNIANIHFRSNHSSSSRGFQINYRTLCQNKLNGVRGVIESTNFPNSYPNGENCNWIIEAPIGQYPILIFSNFQLEGTSLGTCHFDYLEIKAGDDDEPSEDIGKFCGSTLLQSKILSTHRQLFLHFHSDNTGTYSGFQLEWVFSENITTQDGLWTITPTEEDTTTRTITEISRPEGTAITRGTTGMIQPKSCGGMLTKISGSILSPNYPRPYGQAVECNWQIRVSAGSVILLRIVDLELEADDQCRYDNVEIYDGLDKRGRKFGRYCDNNYPAYIQTTSNVASIRFRSDNSLSGRGFYINYQTVCHSKLHGFRGVLESPNYPNNYPHRLNCTWIIEAPMGNKLNLTISHFNLETGRKSACLYDYLEVKEGRDDHPIRTVGKFCNSRDLQPVIASTERQIFLQFRSDSSVSNTGFQLEWIVNGCGGILTQPNGTITSPGYPKPYPKNVDCQWTIEVQPLHSIEITLVDVDLGKLPKCSFGKLTVYSGGDETASKLIETCDTNRPITLTSIGNKMFVKLHADHPDHHSRFMLTYKSVDIQCGGRFTAPTGLIHSTNYPFYYPRTRNCEWLIQIPVNYLVNLTFLDFDIQNSKNCTLDDVRIIDGSSQDARVLGSHCHNTLPPSYISTSNELLVVRKMDSTLLAKGFKATYELVCGARIVTNERGIVAMESSVELQKQTVDCIWTIVAQNPEDHITFTFTEIQVVAIYTENDQCRASYLKVFEGEGTEGLALGTWCNTTVPPPITSSGNALTIHAMSVNKTLYNIKFSGYYSMPNPVCGGNYTSEHGTIVTPGYPNSYPKNFECIWHLRSSPGNGLDLHFKQFDLFESEDCNLDFVEVREENVTGKLIGVYCGKDMNTIHSSTSLWVKFKSGNAEKRGKGFIANYSQSHGGDLSGVSGEIASPLYPLPCMLKGEYSWRVSVDLISSIQISFKDIYIEQSEHECAIYITIYDGYDDNAPELLTACNTLLPGTVRSSSNVVYIKFTTHVIKEGSWFLLSWLQIPRE